MIWHLLLVLLCCFWPAMNALHAQSSQEWERSGDRMMREGDAVSAQICYQKALGSDTTQSLLNRKLGEAAMAAKDYPAAARAFQRSVQLAPDKDKARLSFLASVNAKQSGDYVSWEQGLRMAANTLNTQDDDLEQRITQELGSISQVHRLLKDTGLIAVWNAGIRINGEFAEISPFRAGDSLILFSTSTPLQAFSRTFSPEEQQFRIMEAELKALGIGAPREMSTRINADGYHNAHPVLSADGSRMYFTRCQPGVPQQGSCGLWVARNQRGKWGKPRPLEGLNMSGYNTTQPCLAYIQEQEVLYFASDRPGGQGGWDLWYSV
ncbi:MAG: PD40 domain-containing protein, partial [Bacteroidales bacterium]|nr:PD40 domain-containing protein [Bacteroidales bacterium]